MKNIKRDFFPIGISFALIIASFVIWMLTEYTLDLKFYIGSSLVMVSIVLYFKRKDLYRYLFGATLILVMLNLLSVFFVNFSIGFAGIGINPLALVLLIMFAFMDVEIKNKMFPQEQSVQDEEKNNAL